MPMADKTSNNKLELTARSLELIFTVPNWPPGAMVLPVSLRESGKSRADLWAFAAICAVEFGMELNNRVCDDSWDRSDSDVVCRQLGYARGDAYQNSHWGSVPSHFAMDDVDCRGDERYLQECTYNTSENCESNEGAGVHCYS